MESFDFPLFLKELSAGEMIIFVVKPTKHIKAVFSQQSCPVCDMTGVWKAGSRRITDAPFYLPRSCMIPKKEEHFDEGVTVV